MIKRKVKTKTKKRKNPDLELEVKEILSQFEENVKFKFLTRNVIYFELLQNSTIKNIKFKSGKYVLKLFNTLIDSNKINYLTSLSNLNYIPKIILVNSKFSISKYVSGKNLKMVFDNLAPLEKNHIFAQITALIKRWHKSKLGHGDLRFPNIIIDKNYTVHLIDPFIEMISSNNTHLNSSVEKLIESDIKDLNDIEMIFYD